MVKAMRVVKGQGHCVGSGTNQDTPFSFHTNQLVNSWDTAIEISSRKFKANVMAKVKIHFLFCGNGIFFWNLAN